MYVDWNDLLPGWIKTAHATAKSKGFWDPPPSVARSSLLIIGEVSELYETVRAGEARHPCPKNIPVTGPEDLMTNAEEELADIAIRLFDFCGGHGLPLDFDDEDYLSRINGVFELDDALLSLIDWVKELKYMRASPSVFYLTLRAAEILRISGERLQQCIDAKMRYNATRPFKHGKKF